jgi:Tfp pilus assembly protein PilO
MTMNYRNKIYIMMAAYLACCFALFGYGFTLLEGSNDAAATALKDRRRQYNDLLNEQRSFELGNQDLTTLGTKPYQPDDFFSQDVHVVNEIKTLEALGQESGLEFDLAVSGTAASGTKTPGVTGEIISIPYTINLTGKFADITAFLRRTEQLGFITHIKALSLIAEEGENAGKVKALLNATFYIKK